MTKIQELTQKKNALVKKAEAILDKADSENRDVTPEEQTEVNGLTAEAEHCAKQVTSRSALREIERGAETRRLAEAAEADDPGDAGTPGDGSPSAERFAGLGDFAKAVIRAGVIHKTGVKEALDPRLEKLAAVSGMNEGAGAEGGYLVQTDIASGVITEAFETGQLLSRVRDLRCGDNSNGMEIPIEDESSRVKGSRHGGVQVYWAGEAAQGTAKKPKFALLQLRLNKLIGLAYLTAEMMADAAFLGSYLDAVFTDELAYMGDDAILNGTGAGQPLGILNSAALVTVSKESGQSTLTVLSANIAKMWARLPARSKANAVWLVNQDVIPALDAMVVGTVPTYMPPGGVSELPYGRLKGRPVIELEQCASLTSLGDIVLADLSWYALLRKSGAGANPMKSESSHLRFDYDEMALKWTWRLDGGPLRRAAITPANGSNTISPFVTLEAR